MSERLFVAIAQKLMQHPAAPYHESAVSAEAIEICSEFDLLVKPDQYGNLWVRLNRMQKGRPLVLVAHMDHPGFILRRSIRQRLVGEFNGGVGDSYFKSGTRLRLMPGNYSSRLGKKISSRKEFKIPTKIRKDAHPLFAVWEMADFSLREGRIYSRACDDLIGVASILTALIELKKTGEQGNVIGLLTRAEEVGFHGALVAAQSRKLAKNALVISLETSRELLPAKMGNGVIIRVGDRSSVFDSNATRYLSEVATQTASKDKNFTFQQALMSGGTCEATAFQEFGYQTGAVCVALGNYHNCAARNQIKPEFANVADCLKMMKLMIAAAREMPNYSRLLSPLSKRLNDFTRMAQTRLKQKC